MTYVDIAGRPIAAKRRIVLNPNRRAVYAAPYPFPEPLANVRANGTNRSYHYSTVAESLIMEYGPRIFEALAKPRGRERFAGLGSSN